MKTSMTVIGALAAVAMAQVPIDESKLEIYPPCARICITNMVSLAPTLSRHCDGNRDEACLCQEKDFWYGVRDCTNATCPSEEASKAQDIVLSWCQMHNAFGDTSVDPSSGASLSTFVTKFSVTSDVTSTITSDGSVITTVVPTVVPTESTGLIEITSTTFTPEASETTSDQAPETTGDQASTTATATVTNDDGNPQNTDAPDAAHHATTVPIGIMAAAGLAALLL